MRSTARSSVRLAIICAAALATGGCPPDPCITCVDPTPTVATIQVSPSADTLLSLGDTVRLIATARDAQGAVISGVSFTWNTSSAGVVTVSPNGLATAIANGSANVTATTATVSGTAQLHVSQDVAAVQVSPPTATLAQPGGTQQFTAVARDANGNVVTAAQFIWFSSNHNVAIVNPSGLATGTGAGNAMVIAAARGVPGLASLTIQNTPAVTHALTVSRTGAGTITANPGGIFCGADCERSFAAGTIVTLTPTPDPGSTFTGWGGACTGVGSCAVTMDGPKTVTATFTTSPLGTQALTVTVNGAGTVASNPLGIYCGVACVSSFTNGTAVTLTATANAGAGFVGWGGACSGTGPCVVTMNGSRSVTATFATYTLAVTRTGPGTVTSSAGIACGTDCQEGLPAGTVVTLTATPDAGFAFGGWSGGCSGTGTCTLTMNANQSVVATFGPVLTVTRVGDGVGTVTSTPAGVSCGSACAAGFALGATVTLTATPALGSIFGGWQGACTGTGGCTVTLTAARSVQATFTAATPLLTVSKTGTGAGTVTSAPPGINCGADCTESYPGQAAVTLTATPAAGSLFDGFSGLCSGATTCAITMTGDRTITASFSTAISLTVTKSGTGAGTVTSPSGINCGTDCQELVGQGRNVFLAAGAAPGSIFSRWTTGPCAGSTSFSCSFQVGATAIVADAEFALQPLRALTVTLAGSGSGTVTSAPAGISCGTDCAEDIPQGTTVTLTATAAAGAVFDRWTGGVCNNLTQPVCTFGLSVATAVTARFELPATLTVTAAHGRVTGAGINCGSDCTETYPRGRSVPLVATPDSAYSFVGWSGACTGTGACAPTMDADKSVTANFVPAMALQVSVRGDGFVFLSVPAGTTCFGECLFYYAPGTTVTLTPASQDPAVTFDRFSGACNNTSSCTVTMDVPRIVTATFNVTLTLDRLGTGDGVVSGPPECDFQRGDVTCSIPFGRSVQIDARADAGSRIETWTGCDELTVSPDRHDAACEVTMTGARTIALTFVQIARLTVNKPGLGAGTVVAFPPGITCGTDCVEDYPSGTVITLAATADPGSRFNGWSGQVACPGTGTCTVTHTQMRTVSANFGLLVPITVSKAGVGTGRITSAPAGINCGTDCSEDFPTGTSVTLSATPDSGWLFAGWSGACTGTSTCVIAVSGAASATATFSGGNTLNVSAIATGGAGGHVTSVPAGIDCSTSTPSDCTETYAPGTVVTLTAGAFTSHAFTGWSGACTGTVNPCVVTMSAARSVTATFAPSTFALTVTKAGAGAGTVTSAPAGINCGTDCTEIYSVNTSVVLTATPGAGVTFGGWSGGSCSGTALTCTVSMTVARSVTATFN